MNDNATGAPPLPDTGHYAGPDFVPVQLGVTAPSAHDDEVPPCGPCSAPWQPVIAPAEAVALRYPFDAASELGVTPQGYAYVPAAAVRERLNNVLGAGQWAVRIVREETVAAPGRVDRETGESPTEIIVHGALYVRGAYIGQSCGGAVSKVKGTASDAWEGAKSDLLRRLAKDLGVGAECWQPAFRDGFLRDHCEQVRNARTDKVEWRKRGGNPDPDAEAAHDDAAGPRRSSGRPSNRTGQTRPASPAAVAAEDAPGCPQCGKPMRLRHSKRGDFWGCTGYPECRGTREAGAAAQERTGEYPGHAGGNPEPAPGSAPSGRNDNASPTGAADPPGSADAAPGRGASPPPSGSSFADAPHAGPAQAGAGPGRAPSPPPGLLPFDPPRLTAEELAARERLIHSASVELRESMRAAGIDDAAGQAVAVRELLYTHFMAVRLSALQDDEIDKVRTKARVGQIDWTARVMTGM